MPITNALHAAEMGNYKPKSGLNMKSIRHIESKGDILIMTGQQKGTTFHHVMALRSRSPIGKEEAIQLFDPLAGTESKKKLFKDLISPSGFQSGSTRFTNPELYGARKMRASTMAKTPSESSLSSTDEGASKKKGLIKKLGL